MILAHDYNCPWNFGHDCTCGAGNSSGDTIRTDNSQTLANALARIRDLESQLSEANDRVEMNIAEKYKAFDKIHNLESQRDRLLAVIHYIAQGSQLCLDDPVWRLDETACDLIREIEGGR